MLAITCTYVENAGVNVGELADCMVQLSYFIAMLALIQLAFHITKWVNFF